jgi:hypothetical protein
MRIRIIYNAETIVIFLAEMLPIKLVSWVKAGNMIQALI